MSGWVKLYRQLLESELWLSETFTRGQAWVDLFGLANHVDSFFYLRDHKINVKRGQVGWSQLKLSKRWGWSRSKVRKFLNDLEKEQQVVQQQSHSTSIITILNYEKYQEKGQLDVQQKDNWTYTNKNEKNDKNDKKKEYIAKKPKKPVFSPPTLEQTIQFFIENGFTEASARKAQAYYQDGGWKDSRGNQVKNWKQKMRGVWFKDENRVTNDKHNNFKEREYVGTPDDEISWLKN